MVVEEGFDYVGQAMGEFNVKMRDLEDRQRIMRDRLLLIGKNLLEFKEKTSEDVLGIKKELEKLKQDMQRLTSFLETASTEFSKFARKEDLAVLIKQAKMFQPLEFVRKKDLNDIIKAGKNNW
ncbi:hypothetical protein J4225_01625 [Candidatus Pacearchaeota archaeon]|nr:hypothetical protein [Candidatus Pacearchaeota archaeon]